MARRTTGERHGERTRRRRASKQASKRNRVIPPHPKSRGFTAIEIVVTVVVLAILAAYATPKLFGLKDQADEAQETMKIQDLASRHAREMLEQGKRNGALPTLGGTVGFREAVEAEEAPDTAPMLVDWAWSSSGKMNMTSQYWRGNWVAANLTQGLPFSLSQAPDGVFRCDGGEHYLSESYKNQAIVDFLNSDSITFFRVVRFDTVPDGAMSGRGVGEVGPHCFINYRAEKFSLNNLAPPKGDPWNARGTLEVYEMTPTGSSLTSYYSDTPTTPAGTWVKTFGGTNSEMQTQADIYRLNCKAYSDRYGVPYVTKEWRSNGTLLSSTYNGRETTQWFAIPTVADSDPRVTVVNASPLQTVRNFTLPMLFPTYSFGHCECQGPAPVVPPADPGDPGAYPMASDGSGYCLASGRKLPTYRDGNGTPTASPSDPVAELGTEAVDDATNCP